MIRQNPNYESPHKVWITGEVNVPGIYALQTKGETADEVLKRSGNFTEKAFREGIRMFRKNCQQVPPI